jgi:hypothetical protein
MRSDAAACPTVFIAVYRAYSVRYILESEVFAALRRRPVRIVILHPDHEHEYLRSHFAGPNVVLEPFPQDEILAILKGRPLQVFLNKVRYFTYGGGQTEGPGTRRIFEGYYAKRAWAVRGLAWLLRRSRALRRRFVDVEARLVRTDAARALFEKYRPRALVVSSVGYALDSLLMRQARAHGCRVISVVHSWDNPSSKGYRGAHPDLAVAWNDIMKDELVRLHDLAPEQIVVAGIAHWDAYFRPGGATAEEVRRRHQIPEGRQVVFYAPSGFKHILTTLDVIESLLRRVRAGDLGFAAHVVVRLHPNYFSVENAKWTEKIRADLARVEGLARDYADVVSFSFPRVVNLGRQYVYPMADMLEYADLLRHSDVMVTEYSTCMLEACIFDLPVINVAYQRWRDTALTTANTLEQFDHLRRVFATGGIRQARSEDELVAAIRSYVADREQDADARRRVVEQECGPNRGTASQAVADAIYGDVTAARPT